MKPVGRSTALSAVDDLSALAGYYYVAALVAIPLQVRDREIEGTGTVMPNIGPLEVLALLVLVAVVILVLTLTTRRRT
jgi:hypothetical protein